MKLFKKPTLTNSYPERWGALSTKKISAKKEKGFTLIELLAVIVILGIIMLIATPLILNVINDARKGSFKNSAYGIIKAAENVHIKMMMDNKDFEELSFSYIDSKETSNIDNRKLDYRGTKPVNGTVVINKEGKIGIAIHNGKWCVEKGFEEATVELTNKSKDDCNLPVAPPPIEEPIKDIIDKRDNQVYKTVKIGTQWWMAENLKYTGNGCLSKTWSSSTYDACRANGTEIHYQWGAVMNGSTTPGDQGICPSGWHLPTDEEWKHLEGTVDTTYGVGNAIWDGIGYRGSDAGKKLKTTSGYGSNDYGFNGLLVGFRVNSGILYHVGVYSYWWSSTPSGSDAWLRYMNTSYDTVHRNTGSQASGFSVRCVRN